MKTIINEDKMKGCESRIPNIKRRDLTNYLTTEIDLLKKPIRLWDKEFFEVFVRVHIHYVPT